MSSTEGQQTSVSGTLSPTETGRACRPIFQGEGEVFAFLNALQAAPAVQTLQTAAAIKEFVHRSVDASVEACKRAIAFHGGPIEFCRKQYAGTWCSAERLPTLASPHLHLASTAAPAFPSGGANASPSGINQFLDGLFNPNRTGAELASLAKSATESLHASIMIATNGRMALSGVNVNKQSRERALISESEILTMFAELDVDSDGWIDKVEFLRAFDRMGLPANTEYLRDVLKQHTSSCSEQKLCFDAYKKHVHDSSERCWKAFNELDVDRSGFITEDNLLCALKKMGMKPKPEDARRMIQLLDVNCDHSITFQEFCRFACMLPRIQLDSNAASVWADSTDFVNGRDFRPEMKPDWMAWKRSISGGAAGALAKTLVAPLERMRTLAMASPAGMGVGQALATAWADGGALGLFKGNMATILKAIPGTATQFTTYHGLKDHLNSCLGKKVGGEEEGIVLVHMVAGAFAGAVECTVTHPLETVRTIVSMPTGDTQAHSIMGAMKQVWRNGGVGGVYAGYRAALVGDVVGAALGFTLFEQGKQLFEKAFHRAPDSVETGMVGMASSAFTLSVVLPFEVVQRRMQVAGHGELYKAYRYKNMGHALQTIIRTEGVRALYRGSLASFIKIPASMGLSYGLYDAVNRLVAAEGIRMYSHKKRDLDSSKTGFGELVPLSKPIAPADAKPKES